MKIKETPLKGLKVIQPTVYEDSRGYFFECHNVLKAEQNGLEEVFVQDNISKSSYGVIRGLHFQTQPHAQGKLVCVISGSVLDVAVDLRKDSKTFGQHFSQVLSEENKTQMYIPIGFAHGFAVLSETAIFYYKCNAYFNATSDGGIAFDDQALEIDWRIPESERIVSDKDQHLPKLDDIISPF